jgi:zinc/manganese transport system substrate-binding protein
MIGRELLAGMVASLLTSGIAEAQPPIRVVTTTTDLASIAATIGGDRVEVASFALGIQDPHYVEPKPSLVLGLRRADLYAQIGLQLEVGWAPLLLNQARRPSLQPGGDGHLDLSAYVEVRDVPTTRVTRAEGDVHPFGNPHYWLDPRNGLRIAEAFAARFGELDPSGANIYDQNLLRFEEDLHSAISRWEGLLEPLRGTPVVAYHSSWRYFAEFSGVEILDYIEPKPGIPPAPQHLAEVIERMNGAGVKVIVMEPFYDTRIPQTVAERAGAQLLVLPSSVEGIDGVDDYIALLDHNVRRLVAALSR